MITLLVKSKTGSIVEIPCEELISVDGSPYGGVTVDTLRDSYIHLSGRLQALEAAFFGRNPQSDTSIEG